MANYTLIRLIQQAIKQYKLDLAGYNILLPIYSEESALTPVMASLAGAKNVFVLTKNIEDVDRTAFFEKELGLTSNINFVEKETPLILSSLDIVLYGKGISYIDSSFLSPLKKDCVISILPENMDFNQTNGINTEDCTKKKIPVVSVNPEDPNLSLYKHLAHVAIKRCYENRIDLFKSRILLVSNGELLDNILIYLKSSGAQVYIAHTDKSEDKSYILRHLQEIDAIIIADYPAKSTLSIGKEGFIRIEDLVDINPEIKIIHLAGKIQFNSLSLSKIFIAPSNITQNSLNVNINELGLRAAVELAAASMKVAESLIKLKNRTILSSDSVISYNIINAEGPVILGRIPF